MQQISYVTSTIITAKDINRMRMSVLHYTATDKLFLHSYFKKKFKHSKLCFRRYMNCFCEQS